jgi:hypothetical protein
LLTFRQLACPSAFALVGKVLPVVFLAIAASGCRPRMMACLQDKQVPLTDMNSNALNGRYGLQPTSLIYLQGKECFMDTSGSGYQGWQSQGGEMNNCPNLFMPGTSASEGNFELTLLDAKHVQVRQWRADSLVEEHILVGRFVNGAFRVRPCRSVQRIPLLFGSIHRRQQELMLLNNGDLLLLEKYYSIGGVLIVVSFGYNHEEGGVFGRL